MSNKDTSNGAAGIAVTRMTETEAMKFLKNRKSGVTSITFADGVVFSGRILERVRLSVEPSETAAVRRDVP